ncbi:MAG: DNA N-6-adenine-methyltransferase [Marinagarivorans sp.]|nr:DNA N-6-adenine-methyltransferase [Marinagarivorans sp.]
MTITINVAKIKAALARVEREGDPTGSKTNLVYALRLLQQAQSAYDAANIPASPSVEWYTPAQYVAMAAQAMGGQIDLDPASCAMANQTVMAQTFYTAEQDGLTLPWYGNVFCNPPYGKQTIKFLSRGLDQARATNAQIFLVNRTGAAWYLDIQAKFDAICRVRKRIAFVGSDGCLAKAPRYYNDLLYLGDQRDVFKQVFDKIGAVTFKEQTW